MSVLRVTYDESQHCTAIQERKHRSLAMDCPYTGKGKEFSPSEVVVSGLASCMLISMGTLAMRDELDLSGTCVDVEFTGVERPVMRLDTIVLTFHMPTAFSETDRIKLERTAGTCPIKHSLHPDIRVSAHFVYPG